KQKSDLCRPLPTIFIIQLKRFPYDKYSNEKIDTFIEYPIENLNLYDYLIKTDEIVINDDDSQSSRYNLISISNHYGKTLSSGHYITYAKNYQTQRWYSFNDDYSREIASDKQTLITQDAYILIYMKQNADYKT
ncbi:unnamed protein product, partial [Didymodactylos carnosus]